MLIAVYIFIAVFLIAMIIVVVWTRRKNRKSGEAWSREKTNQKTLSQALKEEREKKGLTVESVADSLHKSPDMIRAWEDGSAVPGTSGLFALAELYGVSVDELMGVEDSK